MKCVEFENAITKDTKALNCEKCCKSWKCTSCIGIRDNTYDDLVSDAGKELHWLCEMCHRDTLSQTSVTHLLRAIDKLSAKMAATEDKINSKVDKTKVFNLEEFCLRRRLVHLVDS